MSRLQILANEDGRFLALLTYMVHRVARVEIGDGRLGQSRFESSYSDNPVIDSFLSLLESMLQTAPLLEGLFTEVEHAAR